MKRRIFCCVLTFLLLIACQREVSPASIQVLTEADAGKTIELSVGDVLEVRLPGNITTGYNWTLAPTETSLLELQGEPEYQEGSNRLGSPGTIILRLKAEKAGEQQLTLEYRKPWEKAHAPQAAFTVNITVKK